MNDLGIENLTNIREIGRGGFSVVYSATNTLLGTRVAVKVLNRFTDESERRNFERECQVMGRLSQHPNVVTVHHAGYASDSSPFLIMELVEGGSLADRLTLAGPMPWTEAIDMTAPIAEALAYVHDAGILHRDVKPENILIGAEGQALLTDFGIARLGDGATNTSSGIAASWLHAPPETFHNQREERSDLYSLASSLHQLIAGQPPFWRDGEDSLNPLMYRLVNEPAPRLDANLAPSQLADLVERSLAKAPELRPDTLRGMSAELARIRNSASPATMIMRPPMPVAPLPQGFNPDARAAAAAPPAWFGPDSQTISAAPYGVDDRAAVRSTNPNRSKVVALTTIGALVALSFLGLLIVVIAESSGGSVTADTPTTTGFANAGGLTTTSGPTTTQPAIGGRLATVIDRGVLACGVNDSLPFFGSANANGEFSGFDIDYCRVVAAAVLGDADAVDYVAISAAERFTALQAGDVDVVMRNTSQTASRSGAEQAAFPFTTFFDGQTVMTRASSGSSSLGDLDGATMCAIEGTTTELNISEILRLRDVDADVVTFENNDLLSQAYEAGTCDAWTTDASVLANYRSTLERPEDHVIFAELLTSELLGPVVADGDAEWTAAVRWAVMATVQAWEVGIDSTNIDSYDGPDLTARTIAGLTDFDPGLGLQPEYARLVIQQVGNYEEIYNANLEDSGLPLEGSANDLVRNGGQMFAPPLR